MQARMTTAIDARTRTIEEWYLIMCNWYKNKNP
jgi:hypothetical protein